MIFAKINYIKLLIFCANKILIANYKILQVCLKLAKYCIKKSHYLLNNIKNNNLLVITKDLIFRNKKITKREIFIIYFF